MKKTKTIFLVIAFAFMVMLFRVQSVEAQCDCGWDCSGTVASCKSGNTGNCPYSWRGYCDGGGSGTCTEQCYGSISADVNCGGVPQHISCDSFSKRESGCCCTEPYCGQPPPTPTPTRVATPIVRPTATPTVGPSPTCDAQVTNFSPCYNSSVPVGSCWDVNIRLRGQITNLGNSTSNISYRVIDYSGTVIYSGESLSLRPGQVYDFNHTELPCPGGPSTCPDSGVIYCGGLRLIASCTDKTDTNPLNNEISVPGQRIPPCQVATPTPTTTPTSAPAPGWFQTQEGDVHAGGRIASAIPTTAPNRNFSLFGLAGSPGIISYHGVTEPNFGAGYPSNNDNIHWVVKTPAQKRSFDYFYNLVGSPAANFSGSSLPRDTGIYYAVGNIAISSIEGGSLGSSKRIVVLIRGSLDISTDIDIPANLASSLVVIASGNINISGSVSKLAGVFLADGLIDSGVANTQLRVEGAFISNNLNLRRDLGLGNRNTPAELFVNRPDFFINSHLLLWKSSFASWQELVP